MNRFTAHAGSAVPLRRDHVDTDQIIPARFCKRTELTGYGDGLFGDWRTDPAFVLNDPRHRGATILVAGRNFGAGSSREAAVWALRDHGFRCVIAAGFSDIFLGNCLLNGLAAIVQPPGVIRSMWAAIEERPAITISVDLFDLSIRYGPVLSRFALDPETRTRLLNGIDPIAATLANEADIAAYEKTRIPTPTTAGEWELTS